MSLDFRNRAAVEVWVGFMLAAAKQEMENTGALLPTAVVVATRQDGNVIEEGVAVEPIQGRAPFDAAAEAEWLAQIKESAKQGHAIAVITIGEAFAIKAPPGVDQQLLADSLGTHDRSQLDEVVAVDMEHSMLGSFGYMANVIRGDGEKVKLTPFRQRSMQARFGSLLKP